MKKVFEFVAVIIIGFVVLTLVAALLYGCVELWALMLHG